MPRKTKADYIEECKKLAVNLKDYELESDSKLKDMNLKELQALKEYIVASTKDSSDDNVLIVKEDKIQEKSFEDEYQEWKIWKKANKKNLKKERNKKYRKVYLDIRKGTRHFDKLERVLIYFDDPNYLHTLYPMIHNNLQSNVVSKKAKEIGIDIDWSFEGIGKLMRKRIIERMQNFVLDAYIDSLLNQFDEDMVILMNPFKPEHFRIQNFVFGDKKNYIDLEYSDDE